MPQGLPKQAIPLNFAGGLDQKTDPKQVQLGKFLGLENSVFNKQGLLQKRNGYGNLTALPDTSATFLTTFNGNLTAIGTKLEALVEGANQWVNKGNLQPMELSTLPLIRSNTNQTQSDTAIADNGLICTVFTDVAGGTTTYKYAVADSVTGQNVVAPRAIPVTSGAITGVPKVFFLGRHFVIVFDNTISSTHHLQYIAVNVNNPSVATANTEISASYAPASTLAFDGVVANNSLYMAWNGADGGGAIRVTYLDSTLTLHNTVAFSGHTATLMSITADTSNSTPVIWATFYSTNNTYTLAVSPVLTTILAPTLALATQVIVNIASSANNNVNNIFVEFPAAYPYDSGIPTHYISGLTVTQAGSVASNTTVARSVGLASKAFLVDGIIYMLAIYYSVFQPTYFLINSLGNVVAKFAYSNAGTYYITGLPSVNVVNNVARLSYLYKDLIAAVNKTQGIPNAAGVYAQTGINLVNLTIGTSDVSVSEIGQNLHMTGGFLWDYDGYSPVENGFFVWPDNVEVTTATTGGSLIPQQYFYVATYEWSDNQGNINRSAPSIPVGVLVPPGTNTNANTVNLPTLRLTYKTANPVKLVIYRWSTAQQTYYQVTSITNPILNATDTDFKGFLDTQSDDQIIGNSILYTTGGVIENISPSAVAVTTLFDDRLWYITSEDPNLAGYSKQVIENTPVEASDLFTMYIAPSIGAQGSTGPNKCMAPMDDKLVFFKPNAILYINGSGPDNTGANSQYSQPIFVTSTVGCANQNSIVFQPQGLMFQSDKGIWLLGRDLQTSYIGAPVEDFTKNAVVQSAVNVPGTNQVRFTLDSGITLMYDYFFGQWGTFVNIPALSSTLYQGLHTYMNSFGQVFQETPGLYLDGSAPVLMSFTTSWVNLAGLQGYQRAYFFYLLGDYLSPHKLYLTVAYDYNPSPTESRTITPDNASGVWGGDPLWGDGQYWGGTASLEQWKMFLDRQRCQSFQIKLQEIFDPTKGRVAGAGFTLSGLNLVVGMKKGYKPIRTSRTV